MLKRLATAALIAGLGLGVAGCAEDGYGYGGLAVGYGAPGYYDGYGPYDGYGYGYPSYYGWYDGFYYPGSGFFVYDQFRRPYRWNDGQRHYWEGHRDGDRRAANWAGFAHQGAAQGFSGGPRAGGTASGGQGFRSGAQRASGGRGGGGHGGGGHHH